MIFIETFFKAMAIILTIFIVFSVYPALAQGWFVQPLFWLLYLAALLMDIWLINRLKSIQRKK